MRPFLLPEGLLFLSIYCFTKPTQDAPVFFSLILTHILQVDAVKRPQWLNVTFDRFINPSMGIGLSGSSPKMWVRISFLSGGGMGLPFLGHGHRGTFGYSSLQGLKIIAETEDSKS